MFYRISHYLTNDKRQWTSIYDIDNPNYDLTLEIFALGKNTYRLYYGFC